MTGRQLLSTVVIASLLVGLTPPVARAGEPEPSPAAALDLRGAIQREAARVAADRLVTAKPSAAADAARARESHAAEEQGPLMQSTGGGAGGHVMMILGVVSALASVGATYYVIKQMQKTTTTQPK